ncbi:heavy metal translocating P-type ATPase [Tomitella fengzijianii]|uniref:Heavy metal translocating P-type ATPase n=1 Tax=Tomitella fengzijianii TaxID=2597660 RepID=A0A516X6N1_9ACTN|nr:heavy metal translocating P-type ATPase [Tomitella fengzijianii]QDQ98732.1 heavy metal translocating P-type ATPase [Tomitella fengzijianii]
MNGHEAGHHGHAGTAAHGDHRQHDEHAEHSDNSGHAGHGSHGSQSHAGHGAGGHADHVAQFRRLFWFNLVLAVPVVAFSGAFAHLIGYHLPGGVGWIAPVLGTVMYVWGGRPFLTGGWDELRKRQPGMMLLISLGITVAFLSSWGATLSILDSGLEFWWELALLVVIMLLGHWIEMRSLAGTTSALESLASLLPDEAERVDPDTGEATAVDPADLSVGDVVLVRPGGGVPVDGAVIDGSAHVDESMITGESRPVRRGVGDTVVAGTVATDSGLRLRVTATGDDTALSGIRRLVEEAQGSSSRAQRIADRAAALLFWFALGAAVLTAIAWAVAGSGDDAVVRVITVLVIACPHALGLAIPLVVAIATERAARAGVLVKDRLALERMRSVDVVVFDKTGTLTEGEPEVTGLIAVDEGGEQRVLALAAAAESPSEHPLARAIVRRAEADGVAVPGAAEFSSSPAVGVTALVDGAEVRVGGPHLLGEAGRDPLDGTRRWRDHGDTVLHVLRGGEVIGAIAVADAVRPQSQPAVDALHRAGVEVVMITGDAESVARSVADDLGIDGVFAGVRPEDKAARVKGLQDDGRVVAMVGDGVNDAPALAQADVGIAIGAGTDVAIGSAGVVLAGDDPRAVLSVIALSRAGYRKMKQNLWWAAGYNLVSVPLAAGVLAPIGFTMPMSVGAVLMSLSTVVVALNAQLLRRLDLDPATVAGAVRADEERVPAAVAAR